MFCAFCTTLHILHNSANFAIFRTFCTLLHILHNLAKSYTFCTSLSVFHNLCAIFTILHILHNFAHFALVSICSTSASSSFWSLFYIRSLSPEVAFMTCVKYQDDEALHQVAERLYRAVTRVPYTARWGWKWEFGFCILYKVHRKMEILFLLFCCKIHLLKQIYRIEVCWREAEEEGSEAEVIDYK